MIKEECSCIESTSRPCIMPCTCQCFHHRPCEDCGIIHPGMSCHDTEKEFGKSVNL